MTREWSREEQPELAANRILDAAEKVFIEVGVSAAGMAEIADAAGCSRGTLYRYFKNRHDLHIAYVKRAGRSIAQSVAEEIAGIVDPRRRVVEYILASVRLVRENPGTAAWFEPGAAGMAARMSQSAEVIGTLTNSFDEPALDRGRRGRKRRLRTRWVVRVIISLLQDPARSEAEERALVEQFVAPSLLPERP